jgi:hypothetical protein
MQIQTNFHFNFCLFTFRGLKGPICIQSTEQRQLETHLDIGTDLIPPVFCALLPSLYFQYPNKLIHEFGITAMYKKTFTLNYYAQENSSNQATYKDNCMQHNVKKPYTQLMKLLSPNRLRCTVTSGSII